MKKKRRKKNPWTVPQRYLDYLDYSGYGTGINKEAKKLLRDNRTLPIIDCDLHAQWWDELEIALAYGYTRKEIGGWQVSMRPNKKFILACEDILAPATIVRKEWKCAMGNTIEMWAAHIEDEDHLINVFD